MVAKLSEWVRKYGTKYRVGEMVREGKLFRIEDGIYSDVADVPEVEVVLDEHLRIYDKERLLIETMWFRTKLPYDLYREVIGSFRNMRNELYGTRIDDHLKEFPRRKSIIDAIRREVY